MTDQRQLAEAEAGGAELGRDFRVFATGQAVSVVGDRVATIALVFLVIRLSNSYAPALALYYVCRLLPTLVGGLAVGVLVDHFDRRRLLISCDLGRAGLLAVVPMLADLQTWFLYPVVLLVSALTLVFDTTARAALPDVLPEPSMMKANALLQGIQTAGDFAYAVGGALVFALRLQTPFYIDAATFLFSALMISGMRIPRLESHPLPRLRITFSQMPSGLAYLRSQPFLRRSSLAFALAPFAGGIALVVSPLYASHILGHSGALFGPLHSGAFRFGVLEVSIGLGALLGSVVTPVLAARRPRGFLFGLGLTGMGAVSVLLAFTTNLYAAALIMATSGFFNSLFLISGMTLLQALTPSDIRGRVASANLTLINSSLALGSAAAGGFLLLSSYDTLWVVVGGIIATASLFIWLSAEARRQP